MMQCPSTLISAKRSDSKSDDSRFESEEGYQFINSYMPKETTKTTKFFNALKSKALFIAAIVGMIAGVVVLDDRYAKEDGLQSKLDLLQSAVIKEMRLEVAKNRNAMISNMQRDADDVEFAIKKLEDANQPVPRFQIEKFKQITRDIEELKNNE